MNCRDVNVWLARDLDGVAEPSADAAAHLEQCAFCREEAGRLQALAAAARAALPRGDVPIDFTDRVMADLVEPAADAALAEQARPRARRWIPVLAALLVLPFLPWWQRKAPVSGDLLVERAGSWVEADDAESGEVFGLEAQAAAVVHGVKVTALKRSLLVARRPLELRAGEVVLETKEPAVVETAPATVRLRPRTVCVAALGEAENDMSFGRMKQLGPMLLTVTVLAGGATVANAQGEVEVEEKTRAKAEAGQAPVLDEKEIDAEIARLMAALDDATARLKELEAELERIERRPPPGAWPDRRPEAEEHLRRAMELAQGRELEELRRAMKLAQGREVEEMRRAMAEATAHAARQAAENARLRAEIEKLRQRAEPGERIVNVDALTRGIHRTMAQVETLIEENAARATKLAGEAQELALAQIERARKGLARARDRLEVELEKVRDGGESVGLEVEQLRLEVLRQKLTALFEEAVASTARPAKAGQFIATLLDPQASQQARYNAAVQLGEHRSQAGLLALRQALAHRADDGADELVRRACAWSLGRHGPDAVQTVPTLIDHVGDESPYVGYMCHRALAEIAAAAHGVAPGISFDPTWAKEQRVEAMQHWQQWWTDKFEENAERRR